MLETSGLQHRTRGNPWLMKDLVEELMEPCRRPCLVEASVVGSHESDSETMTVRGQLMKLAPRTTRTLQQGFLNMFLERRRAARGAVNLEDDHHCNGKYYQDYEAAGRTETPEDDQDSTNKYPYQESGGLMEKMFIWKATPEDVQYSEHQGFLMLVIGLVWGRPT